MKSEDIKLKDNIVYGVTSSANTTQTSAVDIGMSQNACYGNILPQDHSDPTYESSDYVIEDIKAPALEDIVFHKNIGYGVTPTSSSTIAQKSADRVNQNATYTDVQSSDQYPGEKPDVTDTVYYSTIDDVEPPNEYDYPIM